MKLAILESPQMTAFDTNNPGRYVEFYLGDKNHDYQKFEKGIDSEIVYITGEEYIKRCAKDIFGMSVESMLDDQDVSFDKVDKYAKLMKQGVTFPICYLDYAYKQQEGRHRALAFRQVYGDNAVMPVLILTKTEPTFTNLEELMNYCIDKYGKDNANRYFENLAYNLGYADSIVDDFLGRESTIDPDFEINDELEIEYDDLDI